MLSSGFTGADVSKVFLFGLVATTTLASITDSKHLFPIQVVPHFWPYKQAWRLLTWQLCYTNSTELLFAAMTVYQMRLIERLWGSSKFASFLTTLFLLTTALPPLLLAVILRPLSFSHFNYVPAGPTPLIFALLSQYHAAIPQVYKYRLSAWSPSSSSSSSSTSSTIITLSDKFTTYLLAGQLALSQFPGSLVAAGVGWGAGIAWRADLLPRQMLEWRLPGWVVGGKRATEGFEGLRRRLEGESRATGVEGADAVQSNGGAPTQRRGWGRAVLDGFRGSF